MVITSMSDYTHTAFVSSSELIVGAREALRGVRYDTMIGTGLSGSLVIPYLARRLRKHWAIVRKPNVSSHSGVDVEGSVGGRWIFVDDFVATGATRNRVIEEIEDLVRRHNYLAAEPFTVAHVGSYLYQDKKFKPAEMYMAAA